jgi:ribosomal protein RSM22 (predicted rRNA methylase)
MENVIEELISQYPPPVLKKAADDISARYRRVTTAHDFAIQNDIEAAAYLAARFPATSQALMRVLSEIEGADIQSCLDVGAGTGAGSVMALEHFPMIDTINLIEPNRYLSALGQKILKAAVEAGGQKTIWHDVKAEEMGALALMPHDLVIASYSLNECSAMAIEKILSLLWGVTKKYLVIIDAGTPHGFDVILKARAFAKNHGAFIKAPCPHMLSCPLVALGRFCHFAVRLERDKLHKYLKGGARGFEDEKLSYLILSKDAPLTQSQARLIGAPRLGKVITAEICDADGTVKNITFAKSHPAYKKMKHKKWGDVINTHD